MFVSLWSEVVKIDYCLGGVGGLVFGIYGVSNRCSIIHVLHLIRDAKFEATIDLLFDFPSYFCNFGHASLK